VNMGRLALGLALLPPDGPALRPRLAAGSSLGGASFAAMAFNDSAAAKTQFPTHPPTFYKPQYTRRWRRQRIAHRGRRRVMIHHPEAARTVVSVLEGHRLLQEPV
jgi:hypothetical protein